MLNETHRGQQLTDNWSEFKETKQTIIKQQPSLVQEKHYQVRRCAMVMFCKWEYKKNTTIRHNKRIS